jgi:hypothetical protein
MASLCALRGSALDDPDPEVLLERDDILAAIEIEERGQKGWKALFFDGGVRGNKRVLLACTIQFFQELTGTNSQLNRYRMTRAILKPPSPQLSPTIPPSYTSSR